MKRDFAIKWIGRDRNIVQEGMAHEVDGINSLLDISKDLMTKIDIEYQSIEVAPIFLKALQYGYAIDLQRDDLSFPDYRPSASSPLRDKQNLRWCNLDHLNKIVFNDLFAESGRWEKMSERDFQSLIDQDQRSKASSQWMNRIRGFLK
jgi:hypothetical protein